MTGNASQKRQTPRQRVLAADDDPIMREMMMARLGDDVDVVVAENGEIAWEKLVDENFDLAIIDLGMPRLDGFGLIRYLRQTPKTVDLPIIVATSRGDQEAIEKAFTSGASGFVTKPINWSLFKYNVQFVLKNGATERQLRRAQAEADIANYTKENLLALLAQEFNKSAANPNGYVRPRALDDAILYSHLLSKAPQFNASPVDVNQVILKSARRCQPHATEKSVKIMARKTLADILVNVDQTVWGDAISRLICRAIRSAPAGGTVEIMIGGQRDGSLVFSVRDNGQIISNGEIDQKLMILSGPSRKFLENIDDLDLDLPIVKRAVEIHGGKALFQNKIGEGNVSALWLPSARVDVQQLEQSA
jgi:CheY-like chemotaxis protein